MNKISIILVLILSFIGLQLSGQEILNSSDALRITLENNYGIQIAKNATAIASNNTSKFNTGELPSIRLNSGINYGVTGSEINFNDENVPASSTWVTNGIDYNAGIGLDYLIYDFKGRDLNKQKLREILSATELDERRSVELNMLATLASYYNIAQIQENLYAQEEVLRISKERKERADFQLQYGKNNRLAVLNAEVDINRDSIDYLNLKQQLQNEKRDFNLLLGRSVSTHFEIDTSLKFRDDLFLDRLINDAFNKNIEMLILEKETQLGELDIRINNTTLKPRISASSSLGIFGGFNDKNTNIKNQFASDFAAGVSLSWNIFDGGYTKVRNDNLKVALDNQQLLIDQQRQQLTRDISNSWESYRNQLYIMQVEADNIKTANLNFERTSEQFQKGLISSVEFRQAQLNKLYAQINFNRAKFIAKVNEISLIRLSGNIDQLME